MKPELLDKELRVANCGLRSLILTPNSELLNPLYIEYRKNGKRVGPRITNWLPMKKKNCPPFSPPVSPFVNWYLKDSQSFCAFQKMTGEKIISPIKKDKYGSFLFSKTL